MSYDHVGGAGQYKNCPSPVEKKASYWNGRHMTKTASRIAMNRVCIGRGILLATR